MNTLDKLDRMIRQLAERIKLQNTLDKLDHCTGQLQKMVESRDTKQSDLLKSQHVNIVRSDDVDDSRVVKNIYVPSEIIVDTLVDPSKSILNEIHISSKILAMLWIH